MSSNATGNLLWTADVPVTKAGSTSTVRLSSSAWEATRSDLGYSRALRLVASSSQYISADATALDSQTLSIKFAGVINALPAADAPLFLVVDGVGEMHGLYVTSTGELKFSAGAATASTPAGTTAADQVVVIWFTVGDTLATLPLAGTGYPYGFWVSYDGELPILVQEGVVSAQVPTGGLVAYVGRDDLGATQLDCDLWEVALYSRVLAEQEICLRSEKHDLYAQDILSGDLLASWMGYAYDGASTPSLTGTGAMTGSGSPAVVTIFDETHIVGVQYLSRIRDVEARQVMRVANGGLGEGSVTVFVAPKDVSSLVESGAEVAGNSIDLRQGRTDMRHGFLPHAARIPLRSARTSDDANRIVVSASTDPLEGAFRSSRFISLGTALDASAGGTLQIGANGDANLVPNSGLVFGMVVFRPVGAASAVNLMVLSTPGTVALLRLESDGAVRVDLQDSGGTTHQLDTTLEAAEGEWSHVLGRWDGTTLTAVVNGVESSESVAVGSVQTATGKVTISLSRPAGYLYTALSWSVEDIPVATLRDQSLRLLTTAESASYAYYFATNELDPSDAKIIYDDGPLAIPAASTVDMSLVETLTGAPEVYGKPKPMVIGSVRRAPGVRLDDAGLLHMFHDGPCEIGQIDSGGAPLWRTAELAVTGYVKSPSEIVIRDETSPRALSPGQVVEVVGAGSPTPKATVVGISSRTVDGTDNGRIYIEHQVFLRDDTGIVADTDTPEATLARALTLRTAAPDNQTIDLVFAAASGVYTIAGAAESFRNGRRAGQAVTVSGTVSNDGVYTLAADPVAPYSTVVVIEAVTNETILAAGLAWSEYYDCTVDDDTGVASFVRAPSQRLAASVEVRDNNPRRATWYDGVSADVVFEVGGSSPRGLAATALAQSSHDLSGFDGVADVGAESGVYYGVDDRETAAEILETVASGSGATLAQDLPSGDWLARFSAEPDSSDLDLTDSELFQLRQIESQEPVSAVRVRYAKNHNPLPEDEVVLGGVLGDKGSKWLDVTVGDDSGLTLELESTYRRQDDAALLAQRIFDWYGERRWIFRAEISLTHSPVIFADGAVRITSSRFPILEAGRIMRIRSWSAKDFSIVLELEG